MPPGSPIQTRFQTKTECNSPRPFSDQTSKIHTRFQTWQKLCYHYLDLRAQTKKFIKSISISHFLFLSYSFGFETINTFVNSRSFPQKHTRFQTKLGNCITVFRPKRRKTPTRWGDTYLYGLYKGVPTPGSELHTYHTSSALSGHLVIEFFRTNLRKFSPSISGKYF